MTTTTPKPRGGARPGAGRAGSPRRVALAALADVAGDKSASAEMRMTAAQSILSAGMARFMTINPVEAQHEA